MCSQFFFFFSFCKTISMLKMAYEWPLNTYVFSSCIWMSIDGEKRFWPASTSKGTTSHNLTPWCYLEKSRTANKHLHSKWFCFAFYLQHRHIIQFKGGVKYLITDWSVCGYCSVYIENTQQTTQRTKTGYTDKIETGWQPCFCKQSEVTHSHCKEEELCQAPPFKGKAIIYPH